MEDPQFSAKISFCPHLRLFFYVQADGSEYFFTEAILEATVQRYLDACDTRQAEFMAELTAFARQFPHREITFDREGKVNVRELLAAPIPDDSDASET